MDLVTFCAHDGIVAHYVGGPDGQVLYLCGGQVQPGEKGLGFMEIGGGGNGVARAQQRQGVLQGLVAHRELLIVTVFFRKGSEGAWRSP